MGPNAPNSTNDSTSDRNKSRAGLPLLCPVPRLKSWFTYPYWLPKPPRWLLLSTWRATVTAGACCTIVALILDIVLLSEASTKPRDPATNGSVFYEGPCSQTQSISLLINVVVNLLTTMLLACSNHTVQYLSAPSRHAVNNMHAKGQWLNIGISSFNNWRVLKWRKRFFCALLITTSLPLSLL